MENNTDFSTYPDSVLVDSSKFLKGMFPIENYSYKDNGSSSYKVRKYQKGNTIKNKIRAQYLGGYGEV